ncbi:MAG: single-stranded DNA-binding protein [Paludibacter sp.]
MLKLQIIGHLGQDAVIKDFGTSKYISFSVAHSESYTDKQGVKVEKTQWVSCLKHGESAVLQYMKKGTKVYVEGQLSAKTFDKDGHTQIALNCNVSHIELLSSKPEGQNSGSESPTPQTESVRTEPTSGNQVPPPEGDDLPF